MGIFKPVTITIAEAGPFHVIFKEHRGAYHKIVDALSEVETWAKANNLKCQRSFGHYLDDPGLVEETRLRSRAGCIIEAGEVMSSPLPDGMRVDDIPRQRFAQGEFEGSPRIGPIRVYPKLMAEIQERKLKPGTTGAIEIYDIKGPKEIKTIFLFPIDSGSTLPH